jgi:CBS domain-containing protein
MRTIDVLRRSGVAIAPDQTVRAAAGILERSGVGALAVLDSAKLVGIVTDRDLVRRALARDLAGDSRVDGVMSTPVYTIDANADVHSAFALFRKHGVRRLPVVDGGHFVGMITVDDLVIELANDLVDLARPIGQEIEHAHRDASVPATR